MNECRCLICRETRDPKQLTMEPTVNINPATVALACERLGFEFDPATNLIIVPESAFDVEGGAESYTLRVRYLNQGDDSPLPGYHTLPKDMQDLARELLWAVERGHSAIHLYSSEESQLNWTVAPG